MNFWEKINFWKDTKQKDLSKMQARRPSRVNYDGGLAANKDLLNGIYSGSAVGLQLALPYAYTPIKIPKMLVGSIIITSKDEKTKAAVDKINSLFVDECPVITQTMLIQGSAWRWAKWDDKKRKIVLTSIPDDSITDLIIDTETEEIKEILTDEQIRYSAGESDIRYSRRKRRINKETITEEWTGAVNKKIVYKNVFGSMPVVFAHDALEGQWRGISVYSRILRTLKSNHDLQYNRDEILSKFKPKLAQGLAESADAAKKWLNNNGYNNMAEVDVLLADFFLNVGGETTQFINLPSDATAQHSEAIEKNIKAIIVGSGIPEIYWGNLATGGNYNTAYSQIHVGIEFIKDIQREMTKAYIELANQVMKILSWVDFERYAAVEVKWNALDFVSPTEKASILSSFAGAMSALINSGGATKEQIKYFYDLFFKDAPELSAELMRQGFIDTITEHTSHLGQQVMDIGDLENEIKLRDKNIDI
jgi:hypothetical protein